MAARARLGQAGRSRLVELEGDDDRIAALAAEEAALRAEVAALAAQLTGLRAAAAERFASEVTAELTALAMPHASLTAVVSELDAPGPLRSRRRGDPAGRAPGRAAAAAEQGRVRRRAVPGHAGHRGGLRRRDPVPTFVFDEVDAGVGGKAAVEIGRRLARLARSSQVIVVTHLPQVAAFADNHLVVEKSGDGLVTASGVVRLDRAGRVRELSRMLGGLEDSEFGQAHAEELLAMAAGERGLHHDVDRCRSPLAAGGAPAGSGS